MSAHARRRDPAAVATTGGHAARFVFVGGLHRSGTSLLAELLKAENANYDVHVVEDGFEAFEGWLAERGLHSFDVRFDRAQDNAAALADHLVALEGVEAVLYPGRPDHPDHNRAVALLGGLVSLHPRPVCIL